MPRWTFLEQVVRALGGTQERDAFLALWEAAWRAENHVAAPHKAPADTSGPPVNGRGLTQFARQSAQGAAPNGVKGWIESMPRPLHRIWSHEIPSRNLNFTGRAAELEQLHENLFSRQPSHVQVISGMGGIGKTELATEYVHRNIDTYEIIWWIRAEHQDRVRDALVKLGQRLELRQATTDGARDRTVDRKSVV